MNRNLGVHGRLNKVACSREQVPRRSQRNENGLRGVLSRIMWIGETAPSDSKLAIVSLDTDLGFGASLAIVSLDTGSGFDTSMSGHVYQTCSTFAVADFSYRLFVCSAQLM